MIINFLVPNKRNLALVFNHLFVSQEKKTKSIEKVKNSKAYISN